MSTMARVSAGLLIISLTAGLAPAASGRSAPDATRSARPRSAHLDAQRLEARHGAGRAPSVRLVDAAGPSRTAMAPSAEGSFLGIAGTGAIAPSDTTGAAGVSRVVTAVNIEYAVWDKAATTTPTGTPAPLVAGTLDSLAPRLPGGAFVFDPKVVYDPYRGRFVIAFLAGHGPPFTSGFRKSWIVVVSMPEATVTDPSTWCRRLLRGDQVRRDGAQFSDYPGLGLDRKRVYVTTNQFRFGGAERFEYAQILAIRKSSLYRCGKRVQIDVFAGEDTEDPGGKSQAFTIQPAITETETGANPPEYLVSFQDRSCGAACGKRLTVWRIKKKRKKGLTLSADSVGVGRSRVAPLGTQKDGSPTCALIEHCWDAGDLRLTTAYFDADRGRLYTGHAVRADIAPGDGYLESVVNWFEIDPSPIKKVKVTRRGTLGDSGRDSGWPAVATDAAGNLFVTYSRAGAPLPGEYLSAVAATIPPGAVAPDAVTVLTPGEALYIGDAGRPQRWGDFAAANRDPVDPADVWLVAQYAKADADGPPTPLWQQVVHKASFA
ncbi:MAG: hypothetical protein ACRDH1_00225 [Actinomycetota bacterium]